MTETSLNALLDFVKRSRGFDFSGYKRTSLERRIGKRMEEVGAADYGAYLDVLEAEASEFDQLFNTVLINVTSFFRDAATWDFLRSHVIPQLLDERASIDVLRVWCAGCATGEEAYTLAIVLADAMGEVEFRNRVKIYATDADEEALAQARHATYTAKQVEGVPREALDRYFDRVDSRYGFRADLRRSVIFGRNDLVQDAPISRIDLLVCRNTLMYFTAETQERVLRRFHFALADNGAMVLGKSEMLITHSELFTPVDLKRRVFRKVNNGTMRERLALVAHPDHPPAAAAVADLLSEGAFDTSPLAQLVISGDGRLILANQQARRSLGLTLKDLSRPLQDLEVSYRPVELRAHIDTVREERRTVTLNRVGHAGAGGSRMFDVQISPLVTGSDDGAVAITYVDTTAPEALREELEQSKVELSQAYEEVQSTVEELETTNEELQSTNEELETTNEELQSTNEELETMNEELQSTNEELETMNDELRTRSFELDEVNAFLETILASMGMAVAVIDAAQQVQIWNRHAQDLWGLRPDEAQGQHILALDVGFATEQLKQPIRSVLGGVEERIEIEFEATNRKGRPVACRVTLMPLRVGGDGTVGAIVLMEASDGRATDSHATDGSR